MKRLAELARSATGRVVAAAIGVLVVALIVRGLGPAAVAAVLAGAAPYFAVVVALEAAILGCSTLALRALYGTAARAVPTGQLARAALVGYAVQGLVPAGRAAAEATRASLLARWVGVGRAGAAATRMQAVVLLANALISLPAAIAAMVATADVPGLAWLPIAIAINGAVTLLLGTGLLILVRRGRVGAWLGRRIRRASAFGAELDTALVADQTWPLAAIAWELAGRVVQVVQQAVLIACVGGALARGTALCSEGIHLVGAAVGDLIPGQLGATEGNFTLASGALGLTPAHTVAIALLAHVAQLVWVVIGLVVPLVWRGRAGNAG